MGTALQLLGMLLIVDLAAAFVLVGLVAIVGHRENRRIPLTKLLGALAFLAIISALIYGGLWMILHVTGTSLSK